MTREQQIRHKLAKEIAEYLAQYGEGKLLSLLFHTGVKFGSLTQKEVAKK